MTEAIESMLTMDEVAKLLHVHKNTVRSWSNKGFLPAYQLGPRGDRRFKRREIGSFIRKARVVSKRGYLSVRAGDNIKEG